MPEQNTPEKGSMQNQPGQSSGAGQTNRPGQTGEDDEMQGITGGTSSQGAEESDS
jgi:hypothetical protein